MKILVVGDWHSELHEEVVHHALIGLGHDVHSFAWAHYFRAAGHSFKSLKALLGRAQNKYILGPAVGRLNRDLLAAVKKLSPDLIFIYRGTHILPSTLTEIRKVAPRAVLIGYNNDNPFAGNQHPRLFQYFLAGVPEYDAILAYRHRNIEEFRAVGAQHVELLRSWFVPERNHPVQLDAQERSEYDCEVVFVGHYEDDGRVQCLERIARRGWRLRLFGPGYDWDPVLRRSTELSVLTPIRLVWGEEYNKALCGAKVALCFLSKLNRDTYTRRCFEIPATGTMMLSEYTDDLATMFGEGKEAVFFRSQDEMMSKLDRYLADAARREAVAQGGLRRVHEDGHDVVSRMRQVVALAQELRSKRAGGR